MRRLRLFVRDDEDGSPLGALATGRGGLTEDRFESVLQAGGITIDRRRISDPRTPLRARQEVVIVLEARGHAAQGPRPLDGSRILHIDDALVVIDKPPGLAAQGTQLDVAAGLDAAVRVLLAARGVKAPFVGLVHRLDLDTSGVTVFARTPAALSDLTRQFREGGVEKRYELLVQGVPSFESRLVDAPIAADPDRNGTYATSPRGRSSRTDFRVVERLEGAGLAVSRWEAVPKTGRTHQIRVHAASLGHPLLGDKRYGGPSALTTAGGLRIEPPRVCLHATHLRCAHPDGGVLEVAAPWPEDLAACTAALRLAVRAGLSAARPPPRTGA